MSGDVPADAIISNEHVYAFLKGTRCRLFRISVAAIPCDDLLDDLAGVLVLEIVMDRTAITAGMKNADSCCVTAVASPQGLPCLMIETAGSGKSCADCQAPSKSSQLL